MTTRYDVEVRPQGKRWGVYGVVEVDGTRTSQLVEGGFFQRAAAERCAREYLGAIAEEAERKAGWDPNP